MSRSACTFGGRVQHVRQHVRIPIECESDTRMPELLNDDLWRNVRSQRGTPRRAINLLIGALEIDG